MLLNVGGVSFEVVAPNILAVDRRPASAGRFSCSDDVQMGEVGNIPNKYLNIQRLVGNITTH